MFPQATRQEHDLLGFRDVPNSAYYGVHTLRAVENFSITGKPISSCPDLIVALASIKQSAALANLELGKLSEPTARAISAACEEIRRGDLHDQFVVDLIQGGAGTSTNMNANEVIANRALELLGRQRGEYDVLHPNEHVNMSQSTNDVYPTALKIAAWYAASRFDATLGSLARAFKAKAVEFDDILKMGRTQLQDAVPMTLGQEFGAFAHTIEEDRLRLREAAALICEINLGGTAIGTGINAPMGYAALVKNNLCELTGIPLVTAPNLVEATQDCGAFVHLSSVLKRIAIKLSKICNDLRLLSSGPRAGLNEINLPARQAGSSIMPGKVNPVIPEVVNQVAFEVIGNDVAITLAAEGGQLQLNAFEPLIAYSLFNSFSHLDAACKTLETNCIQGITPNRERLRDIVEGSIGLVTALNPYIGYVNATEVALEAQRSNRGVIELLLEKGLIQQAQLSEILRPESLTGRLSLVDQQV